ncbi:MAG TPA: hypothetical protein VIR79_02430 [Nitrospira sp.]
MKSPVGQSGGIIGRMTYWPAVCCLLLLTLITAPASSQNLPPADLPPEFAEPIKQMKFEKPTRIEGRVLYLDTYDDAIWIEWEKVFASGSWKAVPEGRQFIIYPRDRAMMDLFKTLPKGAPLRVIVQRGDDGKVRALSFDEL